MSLYTIYCQIKEEVEAGRRRRESRTCESRKCRAAREAVTESRRECLAEGQRKKFEVF